MADPALSADLAWRVWLTKYRRQTLDTLATHAAAEDDLGRAIEIVVRGGLGMSTSDTAEFRGGEGAPRRQADWYSYRKLIPEFRRRLQGVVIQQRDALTSRPKLGAWKPELDRMLATNDTMPARDRLTLIRVFEDLRELGYEGGYHAVRRYAQGWQPDQSSLSAVTLVMLSFDPGEAYQFDWSHEIVLINGTTVTVKVEHVRYLLFADAVRSSLSPREPGNGEDEDAA
jgi:hypothetical protein